MQSLGKPAVMPAQTHTHTHTHVGNRKDKSKGIRKAVGVNSSGAAEQPWLSFGLLKRDRVQASARRRSAEPLPAALPRPIDTRTPARTHG